VKKRLSIPLLLCAAGLGYLLLAPPPPIIVPEPEASDPQAPVPDSYAAGVSRRAFDENGQLLERTDAEFLRRFAAEQRVEFDGPRRFGHAGDAGWQATASRGELLENTEVLRLQGDVRVRYATEGVEFLSERMIVNIAENIARSDVPVRVWQGEQETTADRLYIALDREVAVLSGNVRGIYDAPR
jgi:LPS export ABC transporter protein LptC